jgi:hypothetical protein
MCHGSLRAVIESLRSVPARHDKVAPIYDKPSSDDLSRNDNFLQNPHFSGTPEICLDPPSLAGDWGLD